MSPLLSREKARWSRPDFRALFSGPLMPFAVLFVILLVAHLTFYMGPDDADAQGVFLRENGVWGFVTHYYETWSSRQLLELVQAVFGLLPRLVWRIINPCVAVAAALCMSYLAGLLCNTQANWVLCGLMIIYPWENLREAGWISTTLVYLWPVAFGLLALVPVFMLARGATPRLWQMLACTALLPYAANAEQMMIFLLFALSGMALWFFCRQRQIPPLALVQLGIVLLMLIYALTGPGNAARTEAESVSYFKNFPMLSLLERLEMGASLTLSSLMYKRDYVFFFFTLLLAAAVWVRNRQWYFRVLGILPFLVTMVFGTYQRLFVQLAPQLAFFSQSYSGQGIVNLSNCNIITAYLPLLLLYGTAFLCVVGLYLAFGHTPQALGAIVAFVVGVGTRVAIGMSPTIGISGGRTAFLLAMVVVALGAMLYAVLPAKSRFKPLFFVLFTAYAALQIYSVLEM